MQAILESALELHKNGQLARAAELYQHVLANDAENADALHLLGLLHHRQGQHARAVEEIARAVALRPSVPLFHANLAEAYRAQGQFERAVGACQSALQLRPDFPEALSNLGLALHVLGRREEAVEQFGRALSLRPEFAAAHSNLAITLRDVGQIDEALMHFRKAVELAPDDALARTNLGQLLVDRGCAEEGLPHCREAVRLQRDLAAVHHNLGNALRSLGQFVDARSAYLEAIRLDGTLAKSHAHLGLVLQQERRFGEALPWLKQAVELEPDNAPFNEYLAELYAEREEFAEAETYWRRVLQLAPNRAPAHLGLGWALQDQAKSDEAEAAFQSALRLRPGLAQAQLGLSTLLEQGGDLVEAEAMVREAMKSQPDFAPPHGRLAMLLRGKLPDTDLAALKECLENPKLRERPRARLLFALAHVLDARGEYPEAAKLLAEANQLTLEQTRLHKQTYVPPEHERYIDDLQAAFGADFFTRVADTGLPTRRPVFVFGLPRSGTTLVEQVLSSHPKVHGAGELRLARQTLEAVPSLTGRSGERPLACISLLDGATVQILAEQHEAELVRLAGSRTQRVVDKMPDNYLHLGLLAALFPRAVFIHCRRDLRDVAVSCWMTDFRAIRWANDPKHIASRFNEYLRLMEHWRKALPVQIHEVDYEHTVDDLEAVARRLIHACGLEWDPACLRFNETRRPIRTASVTQVRQPIYKTSLARWRNYERELADLFACLPSRSFERVISS